MPKHRPRIKPGSNSGAAYRTSWREVSGPCPVCGHMRWCRITSDGGLVACRRQQQGAHHRIDYRDGSVAWLHRLGDRRPSGPPTPPRPASAKRWPAAADADLDRVYRALLACPELRLRDEHRQQLLHRGLADQDIDRNAYRSLPASSRAGVLRQLRDHFTDQALLSVPGVVCRDGLHGRYLTLSGRPGLLIPVRSAAGHVVGLVVRPDEQEAGRKYVWVSSAYHNGPSPGQRVHVPAGVSPASRAVIVEGVLKADVVHALSGRAVVGLPGCHVTGEALAVLQALGIGEALLALDADAVSNRNVARAKVDGLQQLKAAGFKYGTVDWHLDLGKGLDDALLAWRKGAVGCQTC